MILYHGTAAKYVPQILKNGLVPRSRSGNSNWEGKYESDASLVYLTSAYALHFALAATEETNLALLEIETKDLSQRKFYPDEDFVAQGMSSAHEMPLEEAQGVALKFRARFKHFWRDSLQKMGTCAFKGTVPVSAIRRVAFIDSKERGLLLSNIDPAITPLNFAIKGRYYREFTEWCFGDRTELPDVAETRGYISKMGCDFMQPRLDAMLKESANRNGIRVEKLR